jgi:hypothetical protein
MSLVANGCHALLAGGAFGSYNVSHRAVRRRESRAQVASSAADVSRWRMEKSPFIAAFDRAATFCRDFAQQFVVEELPESLRFDFAAARRPVDVAGRIKFLGGRLLTPAQLSGVEPVRARKYLWVDGKIPQWINLSVHAADAAHTYVEVMVCDRLTADDRALYHQREGNPPFHVLGPAVPPRWVSLAESGKFSLGWRSGEGE